TGLPAEGEPAGHLARHRIQPEQAAGVVVREPERASAREPGAADTDLRPPQHSVRARVDYREARAPQAGDPDPAAADDGVVGIGADTDSRHDLVRRRVEPCDGAVL